MNLKMKHRSLIAVCTLAAGFALPLSAMLVQNPPAAPQAQQPEVEPPPVLAVPQGYRYDARGRRDPFINPVPKPKPKEPDVPVVRPPGLKGVLINEAVLAGVVTSKEPNMNVAVLTAPGGRTYFVYKGDALFDGVIKEIRADGVVFILTPTGRQSTEPPREIERKVRPTPGED